MLALTSNITIPNITKMQVTDVRDHESATPPSLEFLVVVQGAGGKIYQTFRCQITNGICNGVRANASSVSLLDVVESFTQNIATGYTDCQAAMTANSGTGRAKNVETYMASVGLLPAGTVS